MADQSVLEGNKRRDDSNKKVQIAPKSIGSTNSSIVDKKGEKLKLKDNDPNYQPEKKSNEKTSDIHFGTECPSIKSSQNCNDKVNKIEDQSEKKSDKKRSCIGSEKGHSLEMTSDQKGNNNKNKKSISQSVNNLDGNVVKNKLKISSNKQIDEKEGNKSINKNNNDNDENNFKSQTSSVKKSNDKEDNKINNDNDKLQKSLVKKVDDKEDNKINNDNDKLQKSLVKKEDDKEDNKINNDNNKENNDNNKSNNDNNKGNNDNNNINTINNIDEDNNIKNNDNKNDNSNNINIINNDDQNYDNKINNESKISVQTIEDGNNNLINVKTSNINSIKDSDEEENKIISKEALKAHNNYRKLHGSNPLNLNNDLSKLAQEYANELALYKANLDLQPSSNTFKGEALGENLFSDFKRKNGKEVTDFWYNEIQNYNFDRKKLQAKTTHFTQLIWKGTSEVGFGCKSANGMFYFVAFYYPFGNNPMEFKDNVCEKIVENKN